MVFCVLKSIKTQELTQNCQPLIDTWFLDLIRLYLQLRLKVIIAGLQISFVPSCSVLILKKTPMAL